MGIKQAKVIFSKDIGVAFAHDASIYIPESKLSRELIIRVLNVCHSRIDGTVAESYSSLLEAVLKCLPSGTGYACTLQDAVKVVDKAKRIKKDASTFLRAAKSGGDEREASSADVELLPTTTTDLDNLIKEATGRRGGSEGVGGGAFGRDNAGSDDCIRPSSEMSLVKVGGSFGGGSILCDESTAASLRRNSFSRQNRDKVATLREALDDACSIVRKSMPSIGALLDKVHHGYDGKNDSYEAFYDGGEERIVVNLYAFLPKISLNDAPRSLIHDFVTGEFS